MSSPIYEFSNGIRLFRADLLDIQIARYSEPGNPNLHEPVEEEWIGRMIHRVELLSPVFVDVGAAMGYYSILVKRLRPAARVFAVEALPRHVTSLRATLALNGLAPGDVTILQTAVGGITGKATFLDMGYGSQLSPAAAGHDHAAEIEVETQSLRDLLKTTGPVDLMKMDIQGAELEVLNAARDVLAAGQIKHLILGTHGKQIHCGITAILKEAGYTIECDDPAPPMQPDGLIVATVPDCARPIS